MTNKRKVWGYCIIISLVGFVFSQSLTFHSPMPWNTLRNGDIIAKTLIDTAEVKGKTVKLTLYKVEKGRKKRLSVKRFKPQDYSFETKLFSVPQLVFGGKDFLKIEWHIPSSNKDEEKKGVVAPFGVVKLDQMKKEKSLTGKWISGEFTASGLKSTLTDKDYTKVGDNAISLAWNKENLGLVIKEKKGIDKISFSFDGKNGKNAFLSFSDRVVTYFPPHDSLTPVYYKRTVSDSGIQYETKEWKQEIKKQLDGDFVALIIPWYDLGMIGSDGRIFGFSIFLKKSSSRISYPKTAKEEIPGTWGNVTLAEK